MNIAKLYKKILSVMVCGIFIFQQNVRAAEDSNFQSGQFLSRKDNISLEKKILPENIHIPADLARIESKNAGWGNDLIFNLQDCHSSISAQYSIVNILKKLLDNYDLNIVSIEGASGYIDTSILKSFPDEKIKEKTASLLMKQGKLSAGEFFSVISGEDVALYGAEDQQLYQKNLDSFRKIYRENKKSLEFIKNLIRRLEKLENTVYSKQLSIFIFKSRLHEASKISFEIYGKYLLALCDELGIDDIDTLNMKNFLDVIKVEKGINFDQATLESKELLSRMMSMASRPEMEAMVLKTLEFSKDKIGPVEYHNWLLNLARVKDIDLSELDDFVKYINYIQCYQTLDVMGLQCEINKMEYLIREKLFNGQDERTLFSQIELLRKLNGLFSVELTTDDVLYVKNNLRRLKIKYLCDLAGPEKGNNEEKKFAEKLKSLIKTAGEVLDFYVIAEERNMAMLSNTIANMRREGKHLAAIISGGHHSGGLSRIMRQKGLSYLVLMPRYAVETERPYVAILTKKEGPYRELVKSGAYDLALEAFFDSGTIDEYYEMIALALADAFFKNTSNMEELKKQWVDSYSRKYHGMSGRRKDALKYDPVAPDSFEEFLNKVEVSGHQQTLCRVRLDNVVYLINHEGIIDKSTEEPGPLSVPVGENISTKISGKMKYFNRFILPEKEKFASFPTRVIMFLPLPETIKITALTLFNIMGSYDKKIPGTEREPLFAGQSLDNRNKPVYVLHQFNPFRDLSEEEALISEKRKEALRKAVHNALQEGAEMISVSAQLTKDKKLVAEWGKVKVEGIDKCVFELTLDEYRNAPGAGKVLFIEELFEAAKGLIALDINIKSWSHSKYVNYPDVVIPTLMALVERNGMEQDVFLVSYKDEYIKKIKEINSRVSVGITLKDELDKNDLKIHIDEIINEACNRGAFGIALYSEQLSETVVKKMHSAGLKVMVKQAEKDIPRNLWGQTDFIYRNPDDFISGNVRKGPEERESGVFKPGEYSSGSFFADLVKNREGWINPDIMAENFIMELPGRITKDPDFSSALFKFLYSSVERFFNDNRRLHLSFFERPAAERRAGEKQKLIMVYSDRQRAEKTVQNINKIPDVRLWTKDGFALPVTMENSDEEILYIDIITVEKDGKYLKKEDKQSLLSAAEKHGYTGFTSPERKMAIGYAAFPETGENLTVKDIIMDIIPPQAKFNRDYITIILQEYMDSFNIVLEEILHKEIVFPPVFGEIIADTKEEFFLMPPEGKPVYKLRPEMILSAKIEEFIQRMGTPLSLRDKMTRDALVALDVYIKGKIPYFSKIGGEALVEEKNNFEKAVNGLIAEEVNTSGVDRDIMFMIEILLKDIKRKVIAELDNFINEGSGYRVARILERWEDEYKTQIDKIKMEMDGLSQKEKRKREKLIDDRQFVLDFIKKIAIRLADKGMNRMDFLLDSISAPDTAGKMVYFVKGDLLPSDIKRVHEKAAAFVSATTGVSSHFVLVANNFKIPVFHLTGRDGSPVSIKDLEQEILPGMLVAINGKSGELVSDPDDETLREFRKESRNIEAYEIFCDRESSKKAYIGDKAGKRAGLIQVKANADEKAEVYEALVKGADGTGLVRTEEFWLSAEQTPGLRNLINNINDESAAESVKAYFKTKALELFRHSLGKNDSQEIIMNEITLRTIDVADDKKVPFDESDLTGMRYYMEKPSGDVLLELQLEAIYEAVLEFADIILNQTGGKEIFKTDGIARGDIKNTLDNLLSKFSGKIKIKFPQVESRREIRYAGNKIRAVINSISQGHDEYPEAVKFFLEKAVSAGSMIESLEAVDNLDEILPLSDFISIGSNDLIRDIYRSEVEGYLGGNLRGDIRSRRFNREIRGHVLVQLENIIRKVADYNDNSGRNVKVTVCGGTAAIDGYILQTAYLRVKYDVELALSVPRIKIGEAKTFIRYMDPEKLGLLFRAVEERSGGIEDLLWEIIDDMDILEIMNLVIMKKNTKKFILKIKDIINNSQKIKESPGVAENDYLVSLVDKIIDRSRGILGEIKKNPSETRQIFGPYLRILRRQVNTLDKNIGQRGRISAEVDRVKRLIYAEPGIQIIAKSLLERGFFQDDIKDKITLDEKGRVESSEKSESGDILPEKQKEEKTRAEKKVTETLYFQVTGELGIHARPAAAICNEINRMDVSLRIVDGFSRGVNAAIEQIEGGPVEISSVIDMLSLNLSEGSVVSLDISGKARHVKVIKTFMSLLSDGILVDIESLEEKGLKIVTSSVNNEKPGVPLNLIKEDGFIIEEYIKEDPGSQTLAFIDKKEFERKMGEYVPDRDVVEPQTAEVYSKVLRFNLPETQSINKGISKKIIALLSRHKVDAVIPGRLTAEDMDREKENIRVTGSMDPNTLEGLNINGLGYVEMLIQGTENNVAGFVSDFMDTEEIGLTQWSASRHDEDWISMCIAVPESLYKKILSYGGMEAFISGLNIPFSLDIVFFNPEKMEGLNGDIDILTEKKKGLVVILDESSFNSGATDEKVVGDVIDLVSKFLPRLKKDMLEVMAPETKGLNRDTLKRLGKGKMEKIMEVLVRLKDNYRSYCLEAKSVYQMRMENAFESYEAEKVRIDEVSSLKTYNDNTKNRYFAHYADTKDLMDNNHFVAVPPGLEIQRRRAVQNVNRENDRSCDEFYVVAPHEFMTDASKSVFKKKLMDLWMLEGIVSEENVIILDRKKRPYKTSEIYAMVTEWHEKAGTANTGFRIICGELEYDEDSARRNILQLEIDRNAAHNLDQYQMFINLMSMKGMDNPESFYPDILRKQRAQLYTFTPTACPVDLEDEIRRYYERYKEEILIKA